MWDLIINPFVTLLTWMYSIFNNDVVIAIVVLTVIIRMLTYPLYARQIESSKRMQALQPRMKKIQEKYKDDREKLAQAQMELYREAGVNPLGGCLPLLLQFPIIIALYQAVIFALAATPFQLVDLSERLLIPGLDGLIPLQSIWLGMDLTQPPTPPLNPVYSLVLPLLVMVTTWYQFKVSQAQSTANQTPSSGGGAADQAMAMTRSMGTIMPVMFGIFALSFSVGISVYFITSNFVSILQYTPQVKKVLDRLFGIRTADEEKAKFSAVEDDDKPEKSSAEASKSSGGTAKAEKKGDKKEPARTSKGGVRAVKKGSSRSGARGTRKTNR